MFDRFWPRLVIACTALTWTMAAQSQTRLDPALYAQSPVLTEVVLSPDGTRYAFVLHRNGKHGLAVRPVKGDAAAAVLLTSDSRKFNIHWTRWINNQQLLVGIDTGLRGEANALIAVPVGGGSPVELVSDKLFPIDEFLPNSSISRRDVTSVDGRRVLVQLRGRKDRTASAIYEIDVATAEHRLLQAPLPDTPFWFIDGEQRPRVAYRKRSQRWEIHIDALDGRGLREGWVVGKGLNGASPLGFGSDPNLLYVTARHEGSRSVFTVDLKDPTQRLHALDANLSHPQQVNTLLDPRDDRAVGLLDAAEDRAVYWSPVFSEVNRKLREALPGHRFGAIQLSTDNEHYLVSAYAPGEPVQHLIGSRSRGEVKLLTDTWPEISTEMVSPARTVDVPMRDGHVIKATLVVPRGSSGQGLPTLIISRLHGRPTLHFDPLAQMLANQGWAVLDMGTRLQDVADANHLNRQIMRWWAEGYEDLADASDWLIRAGITKPGQVCLLGNRAGSHVVLSAGARLPERFACLVAHEPIGDLLEAKNDFYSEPSGRRVISYRAAELLYGRTFGPLFWDKDLQALSPVRQFAQIKAPTLLVDYVDTAGKSNPMTAALLDESAKAGHPAKLLELDKRDRDRSVPPGLQILNAHVSYYRALAQFLDEQIQAPKGKPVVNAL